MIDNWKESTLIDLAREEPDLALDELYNEVYGLIYNQDYDTLNKKLEYYIRHSERYDLDFGLGLLISTLPAKYHLKNRPTLFKEIELKAYSMYVHSKYKYPSKETTNLLVGLE